MKSYDDRVKHFIKEVSTLGKIIPLPNTNKAIRLLTTEMCTEKGFKRHDGRDYFVHPIALAQTALDFQLIQYRIKQGKVEDVDALLATCLLHDILEDVSWVDSAYLTAEFGENICRLIDNVTKRDGESTEDYLERVQSREISAVVKILDRLNNVATLSKSTIKHRQKQSAETKEYYIPFAKKLRHQYFEDAPFYWQARTIMISIIAEVDRCLEFEGRTLTVSE